ncbi:MAG: hypothetical protein IIA61_09350 [Candidatus Marinimicrobia bacterium]|nr:hypothetical protein [Candidatus Neomarinimicrobiota bacterium]
MDDGILLNLFIGSLILSLMHIVLPNHWMPVVIMGRSQGWQKSKIRQIAVITGVSHSVSTLIIGIVVGMLGIRLTETNLEVMKIIAPAVILVFGIIYLLLGIRQLADRNKTHHHHKKFDNTLNKTGVAAIFSISVAMFFSPCIEIESYFFNASFAGWKGIAVVSITYFVVTILGISLMVESGRRGLESIKFHFLEHYEKHILGVILILMAISFYFLLDN